MVTLVWQEVQADLVCQDRQDHRDQEATSVRLAMTDHWVDQGYKEYSAGQEQQDHRGRWDLWDDREQREGQEQQDNLDLWATTDRMDPPAELGAPEQRD
jgi:hypothetical protein